MEFRFRAGDRTRGVRPPPGSPPAPATGASHREPGSSMASRPPPPPPPQPFEWEAAAWRERIIGQEVERRLIEEACLIEAEVRRELAVARARFHGVSGPVPFAGLDGPLLPLQLPPGAFIGPHGPFLPPVPPPLMPVGMHPIPNGPPPASLGESEGFYGRVEFEQYILVKRRPVPPLKPKHKAILKHKLELREIEPSKSSEILSPETKVSGVKRKADVISASTMPTKLQNVISATTEPPKLQNAARHRRHWSCELCQVTATTRADLNKHLRGRRHLNKFVHCGGLVIGDDKSDKGTGPSDVLRTIHILVNGAIHEVVQKSDLTFASTEPTELQKAISGTTETA